MHTFNYWGPREMIELLVMLGLLVGWAIAWVVDGPGPGRDVSHFVVTLRLIIVSGRKN